MHQVPPEVLKAACERKRCAVNVQQMMLAVLNARFAAESKISSGHDADRGSDVDVHDFMNELLCTDVNDHDLSRNDQICHDFAFDQDLCAHDGHGAHDDDAFVGAHDDPVDFCFASCIDNLDDELDSGSNLLSGVG